MFKNMGGNIHCRNFLGVNFSWGYLMGGNFPSGNFPGGSFPDTITKSSGPILEKILEIIQVTPYDLPR